MPPLVRETVVYSTEINVFLSQELKNRLGFIFAYVFLHKSGSILVHSYMSHAKQRQFFFWSGVWSLSKNFAVIWNMQTLLVRTDYINETKSPLHFVCL